MPCRKSYLVLFSAFISNLNGTGLRMSIQSPLTNELTTTFNKTLLQASWPATIGAATNFDFGKHSGRQTFQHFLLSYR